MNRRQFAKNTLMASAMVSATSIPDISNLIPLNLLAEKPLSVEVINPYNRVPVSLIIDDSTCLVNMAYYGIPQFAEVFPDQYKQDWRKLPREIPDSFVCLLYTSPSPRDGLLS